MSTQKFESNTSRSVFIVCNGTYGNTDFIEHSRRLVEDGYNVFFICKGPKIGVPIYPNLIEISAPGGIFGGVVFSFRARSIIRAKTAIELPQIVHVMYYKGCALLGFLLGSKAVLDIRTGSVSGRLDSLKNFFLGIEARFFKSTTVISEGLAIKLNLLNYSVLPLGCNINNFEAGTNNSRVVFPEIRFVYIGVINGRNLDKFCESFLSFSRASGRRCRFDIYGYGSGECLDRVIQYCMPANSIKFHGWLDYSRQAEILSESDIGVSYVPCTNYFHDQPPTKTFEYLGNGLPVIATRTRENQKIIQDGVNGWLCADDSTGLYKAIERACDGYLNITHLDCTKSVEKNQWSYIYKMHYRPLLADYAVASIGD